MLLSGDSMIPIARNFTIIVILFTIISLLLFYTAYDKESKAIQPGNLIKVLSFSDLNHSLKELNKIAALAAIALISITFLLGPLSKIFPKKFAVFLSSRKTLGLTGFAFALLHAVYSTVFIYGLDLNKIFFNNPKILGVISGIIALIIFFLMAITSTKQAVQRLGYKKWKQLQTTGYIALFFSIAHFILLEIKPDKGFDVRPYGTLFLFIALIALALKILTLFIKVPERKKFEEHLGEK